jgi:Na+/H+ antiporter NhaD/arsenite permease-like protein
MLEGLTIFSLISISVLIVVYFFLITEKINKAIVATLGAVTLIAAQVFRTATSTSQESAFEFISHNLDVLGFVIGMMVLVGIVRESGVFEALAIWLVKLVKGKPQLLLVAIGYLTLIMTTFLSNIPTVLILTPVILVLVRELKLPYFPYLFTMVVLANISGAMTPISDPTTYYQAKTVGLSFTEVISNSGMIVLILSVISLAYILLIFRKQLATTQVSPEDVALYDPKSAIRNKRILIIGLPILFVTILLMVSKEFWFNTFGVSIDNATVTLGAAFLCMLIFHREPKNIFKNLIDWEIIFFFMGLFIVVGALEFTHVIELMAAELVKLTGGAMVYLTLVVSVGSAVLSTFIDNVPYNITMVGAIQAMEAGGLMVYPLWWALNLGTSIGGAGSPIAAACNVIVFGQAEQEKMHIVFVKYLLTAMPLVLINSFITFLIIWFRYL